MIAEPLETHREVKKKDILSYIIRVHDAMHDGFVDGRSELKRIHYRFKASFIEINIQLLISVIV